jgi:hypothetical protein
MEDADCDIILGMPWLENNKGAVIKRDRGTYVSWVSGTSRYEINAAVTRVMPVQVEDEEELGSEGDESDATEGRLTSYAVRIKRGPPTDQSYIPNSGESREAPNYLEPEAASEEEEEPLEAIEWARDLVADVRKMDFRFQFSTNFSNFHARSLLRFLIFTFNSRSLPSISFIHDSQGHQEAGLVKVRFRL